VTELEIILREVVRFSCNQAPDLHVSVLHSETIACDSEAADVEMRSEAADVEMRLSAIHV